MFMNRLRPAAARQLRSFSAATAAPHTKAESKALLKRTAAACAVAGGVYTTGYAMQCNWGNRKDWFDMRFITTKDPDALAEFYQAEDLLKIIAVHPILFNFFMDKVVPDETVQTEETCLLNTDETKFNVRLLGMEVSFQILEEEDEDEDGETYLKSFCRYERFVDWVPLLADRGIKIMLWDQTWRYGFERLEDGTYEVYHKCEDFKGPFPIRWIVYLHQWYVIWGCEKVINGDNFGTEDLDALDEELACVPLHEFKKFVGIIRAAKQEEQAALQSQEQPDEAAVAEISSSIEKLDRLAEREESTIAVAKRSLSRAASARHGGVVGKLVASDADTQQVLQSVINDGKLKRTVTLAMQKMVTSPDLQWEKRFVEGSDVNRTASRKASVRRSFSKKLSAAGAATPQPAASS